MRSQNKNNTTQKEKTTMANYRHFGQSENETFLRGYNRVCYAYTEVDKVILRLQKAKKVQSNEVETLRALRQMVDDVLAYIDEKGTEVGE